jgi:transposase
MKVPTKFVSSLEENQVNQLKALMKNSPKPRVRKRSYAILLSSEGYSIDKIASILEIGRDAVSRWLDSWEQLGLEGLNDRFRSGGPSKLTPEDKQLLVELAQKNPRSISKIRITLFEKTGKSVSNSTIKRALKATAASLQGKDSENPQEANEKAKNLMLLRNPKLN